MSSPDAVRSAVLADDAATPALARFAGAEEQFTELFPPAALQLPLLMLLLFVVFRKLQPVISATQTSIGKIWRTR